MGRGIEAADGLREHAAVRLVLALTLLVLNNATLAVQHRLVDLLGEEAEAIGLEVERALEARHRDVLEEVRAVPGRRAVAVVGAEVVHRLAEAFRVVLGAIEKEVLEEVREASLSALFVARADVIPEVDGDDGDGMVFVDDHAQTVIEDEGAVLDGVGRTVERRHRRRRGFRSRSR